MTDGFETVVGLEIHVELNTASKIFCSCPTDFGSEPNTAICPVCMGFPGTLPVLNKEVVRRAVTIGLATECEITKTFRFDRKNYFYPDNPQNYQISQLYLPICTNGKLVIDTPEGGKTIRIHEMHMEEDAGKLLHDDDKNISYIDFNRAGVPLIEIVTEPDISSGDEAAAFIEKLSNVIQYLGASDCRMNEGSLRADVNVSVRRPGEPLGVRTEMKNLNSLRSVRRAVISEAKRQADLIEAGFDVIMETRRWDDAANTSHAMRSKENTKDYRYFPEPDVPPVYLDDSYIDNIRREMPELPDAVRRRFTEDFGLPEYDASIITGSKNLAVLFEETVRFCGRPKKVSNWMMTEVMRLARARDIYISDIVFSPEKLGRLIELLEEGRITGAVAKQVFERIFDEDVDPDEYIEAQGLAVMGSDSELTDIIKEILEKNSKAVTDYLGGKEKAFGSLVGAVMRETKGKADPAKAGEIIKELIREE